MQNFPGSTKNQMIGGHENLNKSEEHYILHEARNYTVPVKVETKKQKKYPATITAIDLAVMEFDPIQFIIDTILPIGLTILAGLPKIGKSILTVMMMLAVGNGKRLLESLATKKAEVLLISLEDGERTLHNRVIKMLKKFPPCDQVHIATEWGDGFEVNLSYLELFLEDHPLVGLVIIDTLALFTGKKVKGSYFADYENVNKLKKLAEKTNIAILAVHHVVKALPKDWLSGLYGSHGIPGAADTLLLLERVRGTEKGRLHFTGRESGDGSINLKFNKKILIWEEAEFEPQVTPESRVLYDLVDAAKRQMTLAEITALSGKNKTNVQKMLRGMVENGILVQPKRGVYVISTLTDADNGPSDMVDTVAFPPVDQMNAANTTEFRYLWS